ncbi:uncharacterized protein si:ch211-110p13.9 isoform X1 [Oncorhynchus kisutch]|uniref:uncharacterized protein si:ch211-110p13.9 isoform X1 n=3 Tax=Oncorhynchus kisutch TaxID=8019 RepID=UPI00099FAF36|nr:uncharacterized protein LOC109895921 isoform X1 [Oncorhynchus kisutch]
MSKFTTIQLPHWDGGKLKVRFIYLSNRSSFKVTSCPMEGSMVPLFLGADLFSNTDIRTENHPRYHAKFAKKGLATKLNFSSAFRFHGLRVPTANNCMWFYSIQGVFRVAFEMYSKQEQLSVLENFQEVWKSRLNDIPLKMNYNLSVQLDPPPPQIVVEMYDQDLKLKLMSRNPQGYPSQSVEIPEADTGPSGDTSADHDYCFLPNESMPAQPVHLCPSILSQKLQGLEDKLSSEKQLGTDQQETILLLLESIERCVSRPLEERDVADIVLALLEARKWGSVYSSHLLHSIGCWLGQQFHGANSSISQQVEGFKVRHIERITDLPPAEELASELFPEAMRTLLLHWMGLSDDSTLWKRQSEYPILLLILEFANHNLITGVAHVLYSSLKVNLDLANSKELSTEESKTTVVKKTTQVKIT